MTSERKREIIEKYEKLLYEALKADPEGGHDASYHDFKKECSDNGYVGELQQQMWQSIVKRVGINSRKDKKD
ncbi:hypothetical protein [Butyrivibrio sp. MC2013]|uniref:hypothetical protein n=1 Tax=Butyrivibrio sp. MC2013 TaxID=1280686 RepID=UPI000411FCED|nr:hypothetical protein [Butyrivibrio sp. MC2013]